MAIEIIDLGTVPLDGSDGDVARLAFEKVNANFAEHETEISAIEPRLNTIETDIGQLEIGAGQTQSDLTNLTESFNILSSEVGGYSVDIQNLENSREYNLVAGDNITIDRTNPTAPVISSTGGSEVEPVWGQITGALSDQTDLQTALDAKVDQVAGKQLSTEDYTSAEKSKLSGIQVGAQVNVGTNISQGTRTDVNVSINSSTGTGGVLDAASPTQAGVMAATDKLKLNGITEGAQPNYTEMPQAIAEGGSDTNLFSVTSLRIRQAILGWWNNSSFKAKLDTLPAAPVVDNKSYVLKDRAWVEATGSSLFLVDLLLVAGGGAGGTNLGNTFGAGGGGGGGVLETNAVVSAGFSFPVTVGAGGVANTSGPGGNGGDSVFGPHVAAGGGGGGGYDTAYRPGNNGGSGGGSNGAAGLSGGTGVPGQGNRGGGSAGSSRMGGGGGGAGEAGGDALSQTTGGRGGNGRVSNITGSPVTYGGGGGGGAAAGSTDTIGGAGGGGTGGIAGSTPTKGTDGLGGGGGGEGYGSFAVLGGDGGSGRVVVAYLGTPRATGGTISQSGGKTFHTFNSSGTFTVTS